MPWSKGILLFTMAVVTLSSSLRADPEAFSEAVSEDTVRFGKLLIGGQDTVSNNMKTSALRSAESDHWSNEEGRRMPHFMVDRGEESPVPLSEMPASCGFSLKRARRDVSLVAPYRGCHVRKQDTEWRLPLMYNDQEVTLSCPLTQPTIAPTTPAVRDPTDMQQMFGPFPFERPWWYPTYPGVPATLPPTVPPTTTPFQYPFQQPMFPHMYPMPIFDPSYSKGDPAAPPAPQPHYPWYPKLPPYMNGFQSPAEVTTPATTTTAPYQPVHQYPGYPMYPPFYGPQPIKSFVPPTVKYPFMPQYPKDPSFGPRSHKSLSSPALLSSFYRSRR
ncbi:hypothetical protein cypCar_00038693 [Cyprinus carpio]|nr:hypothetical protein cypCar_00038693 [Cyprinus carpio]